MQGVRQHQGSGRALLSSSPAAAMLICSSSAEQSELKGHPILWPSLQQGCGSEPGFRDQREEQLILAASSNRVCFPSTASSHRCTPSCPQTSSFSSVSPSCPREGGELIFPVTVSPVGIHKRWVTFQPRRLPWAVPPHLPSAPLWTQSSCPKSSYSHSIGPGDANSTQVRGNVGTTEMQSKRCPWPQGNGGRGGSSPCACAVPGASPASWLSSAEALNKEQRDFGGRHGTACDESRLPVPAVTHGSDSSGAWTGSSPEPSAAELLPSGPAAAGL